jgi:hypothetical protein
MPMKIGLMNNPAASVYDEITFMGEAQYEFVDLTIEGPNALGPDKKRFGHSSTSTIFSSLDTLTPACRMPIPSSRSAKPVSMNSNVAPGSSHPSERLS